MATGRAVGTVHRTGGGTYRVVLDDGRSLEATLRGRLKRAGAGDGPVVVGDRVEVEEHPGGAATVEAVLPRRRVLARRGPGGREAKVVAANLDRLVAVVAAREPPFRRELVDRLLVVAESAELEPVLVVNKVDLVEAEEAEGLADPYRRVGYPVLLTSAVTGEGVADLRTVLCRGSSVLMGPSGVGKSSLLNAVEPGLRLRTRPVSRRGGRGRHTTVGAVLLPLGCGGLVADTPGLGDVGIWGIAAGELDRCFPEFEPFLGGCRFAGSCTHTHEPGCAVRGAVEAGAVERARYESYRRLLAEA